LNPTSLHAVVSGDDASATPLKYLQPDEFGAIITSAFNETRRRRVNAPAKLRELVIINGFLSITQFTPT
jgi:hypothetical protein